VYHTVESDSSLWGSNPLAPAWWFEVRFDSAGTFPYHCSIHAGMSDGHRRARKRENGRSASASPVSLQLQLYG